MELTTRHGAIYLLERLARGGTSEVFLAKRCEMKSSTRFVAIKKILPHLALDKEFRDLFIDEARSASTLTHRNIVQIIDIVTEHPDVFIVMEFIHGKDLFKINQKLLQTGRTIPLPLTVFIISNVCDALAYAHQKTDTVGNNLRIVHRDITHRNIIISYDGQVKVIDFGTAIGTSAGFCANHILHANAKGTIAYMSPEQLHGLPVDQRSDIYSIGILLYELLFGTRLFSDMHGDFSIEQQRRKTLAGLPNHHAEIPEELVRIIHRTLAIPPEDRYETVTKLQEDLSSFLTQSYTSPASFDLRYFMRELFAEDIENEDKKLLSFQNR